VNNRRPTAVTVFGVLNIVFGSFWSLCCFSMGGCVFFVGSMLAQPPQGDPELQENIETLRTMAEVPGFVPWMMAFIFGTAVLALFLLIAGIGLLKVQPWGRTISIMIALTPGLEEWQKQEANRRAAQIPQNNASAAANIAQSVVTMVVLVAYSIVLLSFMNTRTVVDAFKPRRDLGYDEYDRDQDADDFERRRFDEPT